MSIAGFFDGVSGWDQLLAKAALLTTMTCSAPSAPPKVEVTFTNKPPEVSYALDHAQLGGFIRSTQFSKHANEVFLTYGLTQSRIRHEYKVAFHHVSNRRGQSCLTADGITVEVIYEPVVYMASELPRGSCRFNTTWQHELQHVNIDVLTLRENVPLIRHTAELALQAAPVVGPFPDDQMTQAQQQVMSVVNAAIENAFTQIDRQLNQRQQLIDTREEYLRLSKACPNER